MHLKPSMLAVAVLSLASCGVGPGGTGNDTGGIIQWTPFIQTTYRDIAAAHCARYKKVAEITSVHPAYGDYIGFRCHFPRGYDPVKASYGASVIVPATARARN
jgi:hypothetical protein